MRHRCCIGIVMQFVKSMQDVIDCATSVPLEHSMQIHQQMHRQIVDKCLACCPHMATMQ